MSTALSTSSIVSVAAVISAALLACVDAPREKVSATAANTDAAAALDAAARAPARPRGPLVEPEGWEIVAAEDDPFPDRMADASCPDGAYMPELLGSEAVFSVDTGSCTYLTARQSALREIADGETINARVWHFALHAGEPAQAHVALRVGDTTALDQTVPIPSEGGLIAVSEVAPRAFAAGTPVFFHLHNHGDNSWSLVELSAGP